MLTPAHTYSARDLVLLLNRAASLAARLSVQLRGTTRVQLSSAHGGRFERDCIVGKCFTPSNVVRK